MLKKFVSYSWMLLFLIFIMPFSVNAQTTYLSEEDAEYKEIVSAVSEYLKETSGESFVLESVDFSNAVKIYSLDSVDFYEEFTPNVLARQPYYWVVYTERFGNEYEMRVCKQDGKWEVVFQTVVEEYHVNYAEELEYLKDEMRDCSELLVADWYPVVFCAKGDNFESVYLFHDENEALYTWIDSYDKRYMPFDTALKQLQMYQDELEELEAKELKQDRLKTILPVVIVIIVLIGGVSSYLYKRIQHR